MRFSADRAATAVGIEMFCLECKRRGGSDGEPSRRVRLRIIILTIYRRRRGGKKRKKISKIGSSRRA